MKKVKENLKISVIRLQTEMEKFYEKVSMKTTWRYISNHGFQVCSWKKALIK